MSRGARSERQGNLRLLEALQLETHAKRDEVNAQYSAMPPLPVEQIRETVIRILGMPPAALIEFFRDYRVRMAGKNSFSYYYLTLRDTRHDDDPEMSAAVERVALALSAYDKARLHLRVSELFGGQYSWELSRGFKKRSRQRDDAELALDMFSIMIQTEKIDAYYRSLRGEDIRAVDAENMHRLLEHWSTLATRRVSHRQSSAAVNLERTPSLAPPERL